MVRRASRSYYVDDPFYVQHPKSAKKEVAKVQDATTLSKTFDTKTKNGRAAIVTAWAMGVATWVALYVTLTVLFPWTTPWLWACFTAGLIPAALLVLGVYWLYYWIEYGEWP